MFQVAKQSVSAVRGVSDLTRSWLLWSGVGVGIVYGFVRNMYLERKESIVRKMEHEELEGKILARAVKDYKKIYPDPLSPVEALFAEGQRISEEEKAKKAPVKGKNVSNVH